MNAEIQVTQWAAALIAERASDFEELRREAVAHWKKGRRIHGLRTQSRRLRAALEDLRDCLPHADELLSICKHLSDETAGARDAGVMIERLTRYRRSALPAERAEIKSICDDLRKTSAKGLKKAKRAVKTYSVEAAL